MNRFLTLCLVTLFIKQGSGLLRKREAPAIHISPIVHSDESAVTARIDAMERKMLAAQAALAAPPVTLQNPSVANAIARHELRNEDETARENELGDLEDKEMEAKRSGKLEGGSRALKHAAAQRAKDMAEVEHADRVAIEDTESQLEDQLTNKEAQDRSEEERERDDDVADERHAEMKWVSESVGASDDAQLEDGVNAALDTAEATEEQASEETNRLNSEETQRLAAENAEAAVKVQSKLAPASQGVTVHEETTAQTPPAERSADQGCATGVLDHPCPCIEEMMKEPCPEPPPPGAEHGGPVTCKDILAKAAAEEKKSGLTESTKKIVTHQEMKGPPLIVRRTERAGEEAQ